MSAAPRSKTYRGTCVPSLWLEIRKSAIVRMIALTNRQLMPKKKSTAFLKRRVLI
jgi:hypothetical protein